MSSIAWGGAALGIALAVTSCTSSRGSGDGVTAKAAAAQVGGPSADSLYVADFAETCNPVTPPVSCGTGGEQQLEQSGRHRRRHRRCGPDDGMPGRRRGVAGVTTAAV